MIKSAEISISKIPTEAHGPAQTERSTCMHVVRCFAFVYKFEVISSTADRNKKVNKSYAELSSCLKHLYC